MKIIPAIDIMEGKCVRLTQGDYSQIKIYHKNPLEQAKFFEDHGMEYLHLVDLDGARSQRIINYKTLEKIASKTALKIDFGGGVKSDESVRIAFDCGASQVTGGSIAVKEKPVFLNWLQKYGAERIILGADVKNKKIATDGWQETSSLELFDFLENYTTRGICYCICTDISKDGLLQGTSLDMYRETIARFTDLKLIASGGVTTLKELESLSEMGLHGAIIGKALYEKTIHIKALSKFILEHN